jgi:C-terminal processing protease CtpA/Prc
MRMSLALLAALLLAQPVQGQTRRGGISDSAKIYLESALSILRNRAYYRDRVDWKLTRDSCFSIAEGAQSPSETYAAIRYAIRCLKDNHSGFRTPSQIENYAALTLKDNPRPEVRTCADSIGYIRMPGFGSLQDSVLMQYVKGMRARIDSVARLGILGWILDLRGNTGGNMWPMLASLLWFLPSDTLGMFIGLNGSKWLWNRRCGFRDTLAACSPTLTPVFLNTRMAIIQGERTASSGEAVLIAVKSRPRTRTFGRASSGQSTSNGIFWLSDRAAIVLTTAVFADRFGNTYGEAVTPDVTTSPDTTSVDEELGVALHWVRSGTQ